MIWLGIPDGYTNLTPKFETQEIVGILGEVADNDILVLTLTGALSDETSTGGADCIVIVGRFKPFNKADANKDGVVDMADFDITAANWLASSIVEDYEETIPLVSPYCKPSAVTKHLLGTSSKEHWTSNPMVKRAIRLTPKL